MASRNTSKKVYKQIEAEGLLSGRRWNVYKTLFKIGPSTAAEISQADCSSFKNPAKGDNSHARLSELKEMGAVEEVGERTCSTTGREVILWDVTSQIPVKIVKKPNKEKIALGLAVELIEAIEAVMCRCVNPARKLKEIALEIKKAKEKVS